MRYVKNEVYALIFVKPPTKFYCSTFNKQELGSKKSTDRPQINRINKENIVLPMQLNFPIGKQDCCCNKKSDRARSKSSKSCRKAWQTAIRLAITSTAIVAVGCASSQTTPNNSIQVPENVRSAFAATYPGISPTWEEQPYGFEAEFIKDGIEYEVEFSASGQWLETEYEVTQDYQFSLLVLDRVKQEYPGWAITKREIEITPQGKFYEVEIEQGGQQIELYFDERGNKAQNSNEDA
jgi:hypothetical protein